MATRENAPQNATEAWGQAAARRKYGLGPDGLPLVSSTFPEQEVGFIASVPAPEWFAHVPADQAPAVAAALLEYMQNRGGQNKASKTPESYRQNVIAALNGGGTEDGARLRDKDSLADAVRSEITVLATTAKPNATKAEIDKTVGDNYDAYRAKHGERILASGQFRVAKKGAKEGAAEAITIEM